MILRSGTIHQLFVAGRPRSPWATAPHIIAPQRARPIRHAAVHTMATAADASTQTTELPGAQLTRQLSSMLMCAHSCFCTYMTAVPDAPTLIYQNTYINSTYINNTSTVHTSTTTCTGISETFFGTWKPPRYLWRSLGALLLAGQVMYRICTGMCV